MRKGIGINLFTLPLGLLMITSGVVFKASYDADIMALVDIFAGLYTTYNSFFTYRVEA